VLSDNPVLKQRRPNRRRVSTDIAGKRWSDSQKIEAVTTYLMLGNITRTAEVLNIPRPTICSWRETQWWKDLEKELKAEETIVLDQHMKKLVNKSLNIIEDRLEKGDWDYDRKTGKLSRKPVTIKDALAVQTSLQNQRQDLKTVENYVVAQEGINDKLAKLAKSFEEFANKPVVEVTDVIVGTVVEENKEE